MKVTFPAYVIPVLLASAGGFIGAAHIFVGLGVTLCGFVAQLVVLDRRDPNGITAALGYHLLPTAKATGGE